MDCILNWPSFGPHWNTSSTGVQQGDPLGPLLFSLILIDFLSRLLLSQLDWLFSCGTWMMESWLVCALALPPLTNAFMVQVLVSTLIYLNVRSFGLLVICLFWRFHCQRLSPVFLCCKMRELPFLVPVCGDPLIISCHLLARLLIRWLLFRTILRIWGTLKLNSIFSEVVWVFVNLIISCILFPQSVLFFNLNVLIIIFDLL